MSDSRFARSRWQLFFVIGLACVLFATGSAAASRAGVVESSTDSAGDPREMAACIGFGLENDFVTSWGRIPGLIEIPGVSEKSGFRFHTGGYFSEAAHFDYISDQDGWWHYRLTGYTGDPSLTCGWNP